jgi:uncharacterized membrane protein
MEQWLARLHPQVVHFVIAPVLVGLPIYLLAFARRARGLRITATILLAVAALSGVVAAQSGHEAHEGIEDAPGLREPIDKHEELGEDTRDVFLVLLGLELVALWLARSGGSASTESLAGRRKAAMAVQALVALGWVGGTALLYEAAEHGGELVYAYAGGIGTRSGDTVDVQRLLLAGLYNESRADRAAGRTADAARLVDEMARRYPNDPQILMLQAESLVQDRKDGRGALDVLARLPSSPRPAPAEGRGEGRGGMPGMGGPPGGQRAALLRSDAYVLLGMPDSAKATLMALPEAARSRPAVADRLKKLGP